MHAPRVHFSPERRRALRRTAAAGLSLLIPACGPPEPASKPLLVPGDFTDGALRLHWRHWRAGGTERFTLERLRYEQEWPARRTRLTESIDWGDYRLSIHDPGREAVIFRQGFDTDLSATARSGTTPFSVRLPMPRRAIQATVEKRQGGSNFAVVSEVTIDPERDSVERAPREIATQVDVIAAAGEPATKVDVAILGDGYLEAEYPKFVKDAARAAGHLFSIEPFRTREGDFNVHSVFAASAESGITDPYLGLRKDTVFRCGYYAGGSERAIGEGNHYAVREVAAAVPYDFLLILANARRYGGSAYLGGPAVAAIDSAAARYLVIHEFAHAFAGLADEYYLPLSGAPAPRSQFEPWQPNITLSAEHAKWRAHLPAGAAQPTHWNKAEYDRYFAAYVGRYNRLREAGADEAAIERFFDEERRRQAALLAKGGNGRRVGLFEGANGHARGIYRSEVDCIMFSLQTDYFCAACSAALERMIDEHSRGPR